MDKLVAERIWEILKEQNCFDPKKALRIVMLDKKAFLRAVKTWSEENPHKTS